MSLSEGEMVYARRNDRPEEPANYYVVCKLHKSGRSCRIFFAPHWDATLRRRKRGLARVSRARIVGTLHLAT